MLIFLPNLTKNTLLDTLITFTIYVFRKSKSFCFLNIIAKNCPFEILFFERDIFLRKIYF